MKTIIVDDEPMALALLENYVQKTPYLQLEGKFSSALEVLDFFHRGGEVDLAYMDIQMPELTGLDLSRQLPARTMIVFTTAFDQYALEGYKVNAVGYLLKPFNYAEFLSTAEKAKQLQLAATAKEPKKAYIFVKSEYKQVKITLSDILYIEGLKDYVKIYLSSEPSPVLSLLSLKKLTEELPAEQFMRVHRSFIVNLEKVTTIERHQIVFGSQRITIAEGYREAFEAYINGAQV